jgi:hypothetical protein
MELTWITFPAIVAAVSLLAYATAYAVKGTDLRVNRVDVVDVDQAFGDAQGRFLARGRTLATVFSPKNLDYTLAALPRPLNQAGEGPGLLAEPPEGTATGAQTMTSFFGIAEPRFGGMAMGGQSRLGSGSYRYGGLGDRRRTEPQAMIGVRVPIWTTRSTDSTWFDASPAVVEAELSRTGADRLEGKVTNRLGRPLKNPMIAFGRQVYTLDRTIEPGETVPILDFDDQNLGGYLERIQAAIPALQNYEWDNARIDLARADLVKALMFNRAGRSKGLRVNLVLKDLDLSSQLDLGRPILVAELDGPAADLVLGVAPGNDPKITQTTLVRVVLPAVGD